MDRDRSLSYEEGAPVDERETSLWRTSRFEPTPEDLASGAAESEGWEEVEGWMEEDVEERPTCCDCYMDCKTAEWIHDECCGCDTPPSGHDPKSRKEEFMTYGFAYRDRAMATLPRTLERAQAICRLLLFSCDYTDIILAYPQLTAMTVARAEELLASEWAEVLPAEDIGHVRGLVNTLTASTVH